MHARTYSPLPPVQAGARDVCHTVALSVSLPVYSSFPVYLLHSAGLAIAISLCMRAARAMVLILQFCRIGYTRLPHCMPLRYCYISMWWRTAMHVCPCRWLQCIMMSSFRCCRASMTDCDGSSCRFIAGWFSCRGRQTLSNVTGPIMWSHKTPVYVSRPCTIVLCAAAECVSHY